MKRHVRYIASLINILLLSLSLGTNAQEVNRLLSFEQGIMQNTDLINTLPNRATADGGEEYYRIDFRFTGANVASLDEDGVGYDILHIEGFGKMGQVGAPALPAHNEVIAMPPGAIGRIVLLDTEFYEYDGYKIYPALEPAWDTEGSPEPEFWIDESVYNKNEFFPKSIVEITDVGLKRGIPLAMTQIRPVQFNPVTGVIRVYTRINFQIEYEGGSSFAAIADGNSIHFTNLLKRNVINSDNIPDGMIRNTNAKGPAKEYIIITHDQYITAANNLANWKRQMGYSVHICSKSSWTAAQVADSLQDMYDSWTPKPDYFVIIGDHTGSYAVPGDVINTPYSPPDDGPFATDLYHACFDGSTDWHPDIAWGRISVSTLAEANIAVNKIINYEQTPPTTASFYQSILNCAQYQDDDNNGYADRRFCHTSENIRDYLTTEYGYSSSRVYYTSSTASVTSLRYNNALYSNGQLLPSELRTTSFNWGGDETDISAEINAGKFMVFHRDHGYTGGIGWAHPFFLGQNTYGYPDNIAGLSNGDLLPVLFSMNCHTGEYQLNNCFAEEFIRLENKGAVGVVGAAYFSLSGWNDAISLGMIDAIWSDPGVYPVFGTGGTGANYTIGVGNNLYTMGDVLLQGLYAMEQNWNGSSTYDKYEYQLFMYFGDPAMKIWTENPNSNTITATHSADIDCGLTSFSISGSTPYATATLVFDNQLIGETTLDASGTGTINYIISGSGPSVILTISKTNHKPYVATLNLIGTCNPPAVSTDPTTSVSQTGATLNGEILNDFGNTITESGFVYSASPNPVIGGGGVTQIQTSPTVTTGTYSEPITGLTPATTYFVRAYAISAGGTGYGSNESFTTSCGVISSLPFTQEFTTGATPSCWSVIDNQGNGQIWQFTDPVPRAFSSSSAANGYAILDSDQYGNGNSQDSDLVTPEFDFSGFVSVNLYFEHIFRAYSGSSGTLSYSINGGSTWTALQTWTANTGNYTTGAVATYNSDLTSQVAGQSSVMFKWNYTGTWGYYWIVDDVSITGVEGTPATNQNIPLIGGWNILSFCVMPGNPDMLGIVQPLIDGSSLVKVSDETGGFIQYITGVGWMNTIGDMNNTEGYYINVNVNSNLSTNGNEVTFPYDIPLVSGWNIMGYPCDVSQDAIAVLQPLIDNNYLVKVLDESGGFIQYITGVGWINTINTFDPGEGYHINVNTSCTLTLNDPGKGTSPYIKPELPEPVHFASVTTNPFLPMNVVISHISAEGFDVDDGDEIAVYDNEIEVGSVVVQLSGNDYQIITLRADDPLTEIQDGFVEGGQLTFKYWDKSENVTYNDISSITLYGDEGFKRLGTMGTELKISSLGLDEHGLPLRTYLGQNYPNPHTGQTNVEYGIFVDAHVTIGVYDVFGRKVMSVEDKEQKAGNYKVSMDVSSLGAGIYYYRLDVSGGQYEYSETRKMILY